MSPPPVLSLRRLLPSLPVTGRVWRVAHRRRLSFHSKVILETQILECLFRESHDGHRWTRLLARVDGRSAQVASMALRATVILGVGLMSDMDLRPAQARSILKDPVRPSWIPVVTVQLHRAVSTVARTTSTGIVLLALCRTVQLLLLAMVRSSNALFYHLVI